MVLKKKSVFLIRLGFSRNLRVTRFRFGYDVAFLNYKDVFALDRFGENTFGARSGIRRSRKTTKCEDDIMYRKEMKEEIKANQDN